MNSLLFAVLFPPAISQDPSDCERSKSQINDAGVECFTGPFSHLLHSACTDRTLGKAFYGAQDEEKGEG